MKSKAGSWIAGAVLVAALTLVAAWFLLFAPRLDSIDALEAETLSVNGQNDILQMKIDKLEVQFAKLDEYKAEIAALQIQVPTTALLADYTKQVQTIAEASGVVVTLWTPGAPFEFLPAEAVGDDGAAVVGAPPIPGLVAMPFGVTVVGTYANTQAFVNQLQTGTERLFLITALTGDGQLQTEATGGRPATAVGDIELAITGFTYVLQDPFAVLDVPVEPVPLPVPAPGANPLVPVAGS